MLLMLHAKPTAMRYKVAGVTDRQLDRQTRYASLLICHILRAYKGIRHFVLL